MDAYALPFRDAVAAYQAESTPTAALFRAIMAHPAWLVAGEHGPDGLRLAVLNPNGRGRILELFSDDAAVAAFEATAEGPVQSGRVTLAGHALFSGLAEGAVDKIRFDPLSHHGISYVADRLPLLVAWARIVRVELALYAPASLPDPLGALAHHDDYKVVVVQDAGDDELVLAPDASGRALAAVFTAEDTAAAFVKAMAEDTGERFEVRSRAGGPLFGRLDGMGLDGLVFNPLSHLPARALGAAVLPRLTARRAP